MAAILIPMAALAGSAVDVSRMYLVKVRLQQACDAGALAGRKAITDTTTSTLEAAAVTQAQAFFTNNFKPGWMSTQNVVFTPTKTADSRVAGTATAVVPMTVMKMFAMPDQTITVSCEARLDVPDTDILFVLDTTGSMSCTPANTSCTSYSTQTGNVETYTRPADNVSGNKSAPGYAGQTAYNIKEESQSRISALRTAVLAFYDTMAANIQPGTHVRYGFVTYTSVVNAGQAVMDLNPKYVIGGSGAGTTNYSYPSRVQNGEFSSTSTGSATTMTSAACDLLAHTRNPATGYDSTGQATSATRSYSSGKCTVTTTTYVPKWIYQGVSTNVSSYLTSASITDPSKVTGATASWAGCLEEPGGDGSAGSTTFNTSSLPASLNPDIPTSATALWAPWFPEIIYGRNYTSTAATNINPVNGNGEPGSDPMSYWTYNNGEKRKQTNFLSCGKPVRRLATMSRAEVSTYVNAADFKPIGYTYHDTGMIWGVRMISPNGLFANDTAAWPNRPTPNRVIVFLTDGDMLNDEQLYGMYGLEYLDRRVSGTAGFGNLKSFHNARYLAACAKAKALNINIWTVTIAQSLTSEITQCATSTTQALSTTSGSDLTLKFQAIAQQVARLRLSQ